MPSKESTTIFDSEEEQRYLARIQDEIRSLSDLGFALERCVLPGKEKTAEILLRMLSFIGARADEFLCEFRQTDSTRTGLLSYLGRSVFEAYCILCHLLDLPEQEVEGEVMKQIALDKEELHKNIESLFPPESRKKVPEQLGKWRTRRNGAKRWDLSKLTKSGSPPLSELYQMFYPFFNKFAQPTAFALFCDGDKGALRAARGVYLMVTYRCLLDTTTRFRNRDVKH